MNRIECESLKFSKGYYLNKDLFLKTMNLWILKAWTHLFLSVGIWVSFVIMASLKPFISGWETPHKCLHHFCMCIPNSLNYASIIHPCMYLFISNPLRMYTFLMYALNLKALWEHESGAEMQNRCDQQKPTVFVFWFLIVLPSTPWESSHSFPPFNPPVIALVCMCACWVHDTNQSST